MADFFQHGQASWRPVTAGKAAESDEIIKELDKKVENLLLQLMMIESGDFWYYVQRGFLTCVKLVEVEKCRKVSTSFFIDFSIVFDTFRLFPTFLKLVDTFLLFPTFSTLFDFFYFFRHFSTLFDFFWNLSTLFDFFESRKKSKSVGKSRKVSTSFKKVEKC